MQLGIQISVNFFFKTNAYSIKKKDRLYVAIHQTKTTAFSQECAQDLGCTEPSCPA